MVALVLTGSTLLGDPVDADRPAARDDARIADAQATPVGPDKSDPPGRPPTSMRLLRPSDERGHADMPSKSGVDADRRRGANPTNPTPAIEPFAPISSPDDGEHCADDLTAEGLTDFFAEPVGAFQGGDYQRAFRLSDGRVLWTFQDAFVSGTLVHNVGMVQSGRCFTMLNDGARSWLLADETRHMRRWHWILDGAMSADGSTFHLFVVEMTETGGRYLSRTRPTALRRVVLDASSLVAIAVIDEPATGEDLYGWSVTDDGRYTYLYSHCYQQFGYETLLGFGECAAHVKLARIPSGSFDARREYWTGDGWSTDRERAVPVVDGAFVLSGNNPAQVRYDGARFVLIEKRDDWWGETIEIGVAEHPFGPFRHIASLDEPVKCERSVCNTYFATWVPWRDRDGGHIWSIGHNRWEGSTTHLHLDTYRPTFHGIDLAALGIAEER